MDTLSAQVAGVGTLVEPARRALYLFVVAQPDAVSREQAAEAVGLPLHSAKFHLDRLVDEDLLAVEFRRLTGKSGPGAGRPSKLYRRSSRELSVSLPERHYDLVARILAAGIDRAAREGVPVHEGVQAAAKVEGERMAAEVAASVAASADRDEPDELACTASVLGSHGYEPRLTDDELALANCPFDSLAKEHTALVCGMNLTVLRSMLQGLEIQTVEARLDPQAGFCCVRLRRR